MKLFHAFRGVLTVMRLGDSESHEFSECIAAFFSFEQGGSGLFL